MVIARVEFMGNSSVQSLYLRLRYYERLGNTGSPIMAATITNMLKVQHAACIIVSDKLQTATLLTAVLQTVLAIVSMLRSACSMSLYLQLCLTFV